MDQPSIYSKLVENRAIRILRLQLGTFKEEISCMLETISLDDKEKSSYGALSYVWGSPVPPKYIKLNGIRKAITANLFSALNTIRQTDESVYLWVDALCINQDDLDERSQQVLLMREVYSCAKVTILWLGEEREDTVVAIQLIKKASVLWSEDYGPIGDQMDASGVRVPFDVQRNHSQGFPPPGHADWDAVRNFLSNPWFKRMWIIQEVVVSKKLVFFIGKQQLFWDDISLAVTWWFRKDYIDIIPSHLILGPLQIGTCKSENGIPLLSLLAKAKTFQATDPRDKVFALFGLSTESRLDSPCSLLLPDYRKSAFEVILDVMKHCLECNHGYPANLDLLSHVHHWSQYEYVNSSTVPTWMPRWDNDNNMVYMNRAHHASAGLSLCLQAPISSSEIILKGTQVATIVESNDALWRLWVQDNWQPGEIWTIIRDLWMAFAKSRKDEGRMDEFNYLFAQTITTGGSRENKPVTEADFLAYCSGNLEESQTSTSTSELSHSNDSMPNPEDIEAARLLSMSDASWDGSGDGDRIRFQIPHWALFSAEDYIGMGHFTTQPGDIICVLFGGNNPFVLRPTDNHYALVGECYVYGLMDGEAVEKLKTGELTEKWFNLQ